MPHIKARILDAGFFAAIAMRPATIAPGAMPTYHEKTSSKEGIMGWIAAAATSAAFAGMTSVLAKLGVKTTDPDVATALRTCIVFACAWTVAALAGSVESISGITPSSWAFLVMSGLATGGSWICCFKALSMGDVNKVTPIDKSSAVIASLLAIVLFGETAHLALKLICIAAILTGTFMMIERKKTDATACKRGWLAYAVLAALFAALTSILGKIGIDGVESNLGTAIRTTVVLALSWGIVAARGKLTLIERIERRELGFLAASGLTTGISWLLYYYALQAGTVSVVVQIDKLSIVVSIIFARVVLGERLSRKALIGLLIIILSTAAMTACP